jgi:hypothetical protein
MIQASHTTAEILKQQGKGEWLEPREDEVVAKGKGVLNTFWVFPNATERIGRIGPLIVSAEERLLKQNRLEQWIADLLLSRLKEIVARRMVLNKGRAITGSKQQKFDVTTKAGSIPLDEIVEVIAMPAFDTNAVSNIDPTSVEIPANVSDVISARASVSREPPESSSAHRQATASRSDLACLFSSWPARVSHVRFPPIF